jgi:hypothetical protein
LVAGVIFADTVGVNEEIIDICEASGKMEQTHEQQMELERKQTE